MYIDLEAVEREPMRDKGSRRYLKSEIVHLISENERLRAAAEIAEQRLGDNERWWHDAALSQPLNECVKQAFSTRAQTTRTALDIVRAALTPKGSQK